MNSSDNLTDNEIAFAAINLFANKATGAEPGWMEINDWHLDLLDEARAEEVLGHVANNPECFQMWRDICEAAEFLEQSPLEEAQLQTAPTNVSANPAPWDLVGWLTKGVKAITGQPLPAIGGAVAATVLAVLIVPKMLNNPVTNPGDMLNSSLAQYSALGAPLPQTPLTARTSRSLAGLLGNQSKQEVEAQHFNYGLKQAFDVMAEAESTSTELVAWAPWLNSLPESSVDCTLAADEKHCVAISTDMNSLGQWALLNHLACTTTTNLPDDFKQRQNETFVALKNQESISASALLQQGIDSGAENGCSVANNLINIASE